MKNQDNHSYDDIINLPNPTSTKHPRMPLSDRAAQFSPFAALTGYDDALRETARLTEHFIELEEDRKQEIDRQLSYLREHLANPIIVRITYFLPDHQKEDGAYCTLEGQIRKIDQQKKCIRIMEREIPADKIYRIDFVG